MARFEYGDSLAAETRVAGDVAVFGSNGPVGTHKFANTQGPVIVIGRKGSYGQVNYSAEPVFAIDTTYFVDQSTTMHDMRWLYYALSTAGLATLGQDVGVPGLNRDLAYAQRVPLPSLAEQRAIADYLDAETARIDALIAKKQQLIHLLEERRVESIRSIISGAVEPGDRWRPGPGWSLPVPSSWAPQKVAWVKRTGSGTTPASGDERFYSMDGTPWVTTSELRERTIETTAKFVTDEALREHSALEVFPVGTVLIAMYGATVGRLGRLGTAATTNQACCALFGGEELDQAFLYWWLWAYRREIVDLSYGAGQPNISQETIRSLRVPAPDPGRQRQIAQECEKLNDSTDLLLGRAGKQIHLLAERRQALITAAVTGQFVVPGAA